MNVTHLTVYVDPDIGIVVDEDFADNVDGTRNPGTSGVQFTNARSAGDYVAAWLRRMAADVTKPGYGLPFDDAAVAEEGRRKREENSRAKLKDYGERQ